MAVLYCLEKCYERGSLALLWFSGLSAVGDLRQSVPCEKGLNVRKG